MPPSLPPKVLKLTPHVDSCLLLQLLPALLQHYPHRRLVELAGCGNRRILSRVLFNIVQPDITMIFLNIYENIIKRIQKQKNYSIFTENISLSKKK